MTHSATTVSPVEARRLTTSIVVPPYTRREILYTHRINAYALNNLIANHGFPEPFPITKFKDGFDRVAVDDWLANRAREVAGGAE